MRAVLSTTHEVKNRRSRSSWGLLTTWKTTRHPTTSSSAPSACSSSTWRTCVRSARARGFWDREEACPMASVTDSTERRDALVERLFMNAVGAFDLFSVYLGD